MCPPRQIQIRDGRLHHTLSRGDQRLDGIALLDFGGQYRPLIARRVREMNVYSEILPYDAYPLCFEEFGHDLGMSA
ncbi:MAG: hypothetical protein NWE88_01770 [Candidatus Bathyarchaeota archaeon]|nr:hypothetical protein [Candidatus Bathyarchaeota archaeon]